MKRRTKYRKLPNGFGQISYIATRLFNPYRAMITTGHSPEGRPICKLLKPVSYFPTYNDAFAALIEYNKSPNQKAKEMTLKQVYDEWIENQETKVAATSIRRYKASFKRVHEYHDYLMIEIRPRIINLVVKQALQESPNVGSDVKCLLNCLFDYAVNNEIVDKNYARECRIEISSNSEHHISFTDDEVKKLWSNQDDLYSQWILIQCYTGMRPGEFCEIRLENINLEENYMIGGMKTKAGTNRIIPIHPAVKNLIAKQIERSKQIGSEYLLSDKYNPKHYPYEPYKKHFYKVRDQLKLNPEHTPHDCRKFFVTQAKKYKLDEYALKRIVGHTITDLTESVYTERNISWLYDEICKIQVGTE